VTRASSSSKAPAKPAKAEPRSSPTRATKAEPRSSPTRATKAEPRSSPAKATRAEPRSSPAKAAKAEPRSTPAKVAKQRAVADVEIRPPADVLATLRAQREPVAVTMLDPWYNKGVGGEREGYHDWLLEVITEAARISDHIFVWGFPEILAPLMGRLPPPLTLTAWLTWYFKNCPSVIRGWRSAQMTCLHLSRPGARLHPEHFLNEAQLEKQRQGKLRYLPGPPSVFEAALLVGFIGRSEQQGHPSQKPEKAIEPLLLMATQPGDLVLDPMCGSGTTGAVCRRLDRRAILCDAAEEYVQMTERRLKITRTPG